MNNPHDNEYNRLLKTVLEKGRWKNNRTGVKTIGVFGEQAKFDLSQGFPLLTTKKVFFKGIVHELLWFIKGNTNIKYLVDNDVHIWDEWAFTRYKKAYESGKEFPLRLEEFIEEIKTDDSFAKKWGELGEGTYGGMWRGFPYTTQSEEYPNFPLEGTVDQLQKVIDKLKSNPDDRRLIVSAWHPYWVDHCALPPCHVMFQFHTEELTRQERNGIYTGSYRNINADFNDAALDSFNTPKRRLNCQLYQRSCDLFLGVPFNIASYSLLTYMVAKVCNMEPGIFTHTYGDLHLYENSIEAARLQLSRDSFLPPSVSLANKTNLFNFKYEDITLNDYKSHEAIKVAVAV